MHMVHTDRLPVLPQHLHILSTTRNLSPLLSDGSSTSLKSSKNPSLLPPLNPVAHDRIPLTPTMSKPLSLSVICSSFFGAVRSIRSMSLPVSSAQFGQEL